MISVLFLEFVNLRAKIKIALCIILQGVKDLDKDNFKEV
jgi:hypothetical protein